MSIEDYMRTFDGRTVCWYQPGAELTTVPPYRWENDPRFQTPPPSPIPDDPTRIAYCLRGQRYDQDTPSLVELIDAFAEDPNVGVVEALVIGLWDDEGGTSTAVVEALVAARDRFAGLKALFLGDILREEQEISWINQSNVGPLLEAYPSLEVFGVRGGNGLSFGEGGHHLNLRELRVETGGLPEEALRSLWKWQLPNLEKLVLWLGEDNYGGITTPEPLSELLSGKIFPKLTYLGLCDSDIQDAVAEAVSTAPILERIETLDLSLGNLSDVGARSLINSPLVRKLKRLDITHHYVSSEVVEELRELGIEVVDEDRQEPDRYGDEEYRYIAHSE